MDQVNRRLNALGVSVPATSTNTQLHHHTTSAQYNADQIIRFVDRQGHTHYGHPVDSTYKQAVAINTKDVYSDASPKPTSNSPVPVAKLLPPVQPTNVICIGLNYAKHAKESGMNLPSFPIVFFKNLSSVCGHHDNIVLPKQVEYKKQVDYEGELVIVIGKACKNVTPEQALDYVYGYTIAHDVSARDWQLTAERGGGQWCYSKSFDTFCPLGPAVTLAHAVKDPQALQVQTKLNGKVMQDMNTSDMIFSCAKIVSFLSQGSTLSPGTIILTGTPEGVGMKRNPPVWLADGDKVDISITGLGTLSNEVTTEK